MGEFGFITADGVYHVTVYATDENGNFKILSMKNIRVKPYPSGPERTGHSLPFPPSQNPPQPQRPTATQISPHTQGSTALQNPPKIQNPTLQQPLSDVAKPAQPAKAKSCSHCSLPTTTTTTQTPQIMDYAVVTNNPPSNNFVALRTPASQFSKNTPQNPEQSNQDKNNNLDRGQQNPDRIINGNIPEIGVRFNIPESDEYHPIGDKLEENHQQNNVNNQIPQQNNVQSPEKTLQAPFANSPGERNPKQYTDLSQNSFGGERSQESGNDRYNPTIYESQPHSSLRPQGSQELSPELLGSQETEVSQGPVGHRDSQRPQGSNAQQGSIGFSDQSGRQQSFQPSDISEPQGSPGLQNSQIPLLNKPTLISAQMQIVDQNTDIQHKRPGEIDGLPKGLTKDDMLQLLYTFNYTVGFHGHFEEGYTNGAKQGYYYVTGRNGIRTRVDYVADENGFRPKITQEVLDLLSDDVPKPETEKDEKYGLKGYEFKWLYYPVGSKSS
ncbi:hypothetical protein ACJJTC_008917 [Scirpophaga incertulas]